MALAYRCASTSSHLKSSRLPCTKHLSFSFRVNYNRGLLVGTVLRNRSTAGSQPLPQETTGFEEEFVGIPPEDDVEVPGSYMDALNPNTKLGKAVRAATDELNHLNAMEMDTLRQCDELLKKLGLKTSIMQAPTQPQDAGADVNEDD